MYWVYVLKCVDNGFYVGCTDNLRERYKQHNDGLVKNTKSRLPVILWQYHCFRSREVAFSFEKYLKTGSGIAFAKKHFSE
ncbi:GIY-YIG nuclease family protein [Candidatus Shapirobacteria bacterium]|nr:GIY-YIG nuclease family protein [Candidatus Shapirobacteria bacterium]